MKKPPYLRKFNASGSEIGENDGWLTITIMRIGVLSDTHNNIGNLLKALRFFRDEGIEKLIHCGDMVNVTTAKQMSGFDVIYVNGNMDDSAAAVNDALWFLNPNNETAGDGIHRQIGRRKNRRHSRSFAGQAGPIDSLAALCFCLSWPHP